jgi:hypothetical protein
MKRTMVLAMIGSLGVLPHAFAANSTAGTASAARPDGSAITQNFTAAGGVSAWFQAPLTADHSYIAEVEAPFDGAGTLSGGASPTLALAVLQNDGVTPVAMDGGVASCAPAMGVSGARVTFSPSAADLAGGPVKISVTNGVAPDYSFRFRFYETGLSCPRWSINGYLSFVNLQNTTDCPLTLHLVLYRQDGTVASTTPVALATDGAIQISINAGMAGGVLVGSAAVFHNGPKGAVTGGIYQVNNGASGANYLWGFQEIRSSGSTSGQ